MQELGVALAEALAVVAEPWWRHRWIAIAWVVIEGGWATIRHVVAGSFEAVVLTLLVGGSGSDSWWRRAVDGLRVRATCKTECGSDECEGGESHVFSPEETGFVASCE